MTMDGLSAIQRELNPRWCLAYDTIDRHDIDRLIQWLRTYPRLSSQSVHFETPIVGNTDNRDELVSNDRIFSDGFRPDWSPKQGHRELANHVGTS